MRQVNDILCPQNLVEIVEILTKFWRGSIFLLFSLAALYAAFKFLMLFLHCVTVFSGPCLFTSALIVCHTVSHFGISSKKSFLSKVLKERQSVLQTNAFFLCLIE